MSKSLGLGPVGNLEVRAGAREMSVAKAAMTGTGEMFWTLGVTCMEERAEAAKGDTSC